MVSSLLSDLVERGLDAARMRLRVIDGNKVLRKAIMQTCGRRALALIQRCQKYKRRNILEHLPEDAQASAKRVSNDAWAAADAKLVRNRLSRLASSLQARHRSAGASLREGVEEALTAQALASLRRCAARCSPSIPSKTSTARWRTTAATSSAGAMARWCCAGSPARRGDAAWRLRKLHGRSQMRTLLNAPDIHRSDTHSDTAPRAA